MTCPLLNSVYKYGTDFIKRQLHQNLNPFWKDVCTSYIKLSKSFISLNEKQIPAINLWYNPDIKVGGSSVCYRRWLAAGVVFLGDLVNRTGELYSYREFNTIFNINTNFLEFNGLIRAIKNFLQQKGIDYLPSRNFDTVHPINLSIIHKDLKGCKTIYRQLLRKEQFPKTLQKWKDQLSNIPNSDILYNESIYDIVFRNTNDPKLQWLQYRINHRFLGTNYLLKKMNLVPDDNCSFCNIAVETILHLFWTCPVSKDFFQQLKNYIVNKCGVSIIDWTVKDILFGNNKLDNALNTILLQAKLFLYYNKMKKQRPSFQEFKKQIISRYYSERFIAAQNFKMHKFEATWGKYKNLV